MKNKSVIMSNAGGGVREIQLSKKYIILCKME